MEIDRPIAELQFSQPVPKLKLPESKVVKTSVKKFAEDKAFIEDEFIPEEKLPLFKLGTRRTVRTRTRSGTDYMRTVPAEYLKFAQELEEQHKSQPQQQQQQTQPAQRRLVRKETRSGTLVLPVEEELKQPPSLSLVRKETREGTVLLPMEHNPASSSGNGVGTSTMVSSLSGENPENINSTPRRGAKRQYWPGTEVPGAVNTTPSKLDGPPVLTPTVRRTPLLKSASAQNIVSPGQVTILRPGTPPACAGSGGTTPAIAPQLAKFMSTILDGQQTLMKKMERMEERMTALQVDVQALKKQG
jgi:hypothetical protein